MANQPTDVNMSKQNIDMNQDAGRQNIESTQESGVRSGTNEQNANVTGAGETSRSVNQDDIGNPRANTEDPHRSRETGRADTDMNSDTMGGDLSSDS